MKLAIIGAAGVRTPLIIRAISHRKHELGIDELALMDIDADRLGLIRKVQLSDETGLRITATTQLVETLRGAGFVITTFRAGGMEGRVIDERVPLRYGVLGQETTGPGGFAMAMRSIPVLLSTIALMGDLCPDAWLLNFSNPSGIMAEAALRVASWPRAVGICDAPAGMQGNMARIAGVPTHRVTLDYFGLNHLGWIKGVLVDDVDVLPALLDRLQAGLTLPEPSFSAQFLRGLGLIPNEYLVYFYQNRKMVNNILRSEITRGEELFELNRELFADLCRLMGRDEDLRVRYQGYIARRQSTYMAAETGIGSSGDGESDGEQGYAGVALDVISGLVGGVERRLILNVLNQGSIEGMAADDVVEIPARVTTGEIRPERVGRVPPHCLGLMQQVKAYERLTIDAAVTGSYEKAWMALALHPLVADEEIARRILDEYISAHGISFPKLV